MRLRIVLRDNSHFPESTLQYDAELDDVRSIIGDICEALDEMGAADFLVSGFGQERWPVDVRTDLAVFLEQLPRTLASVQSGSSFTLDFYEQGVERTIHFERDGEEYSARCESRTDWTPAPSTERVGRMELLTVLSDARQHLMAFLSQKAPTLASHPWMRSWSGG